MVKKLLWPLITLIPVVLIALMIFGFSSESGVQSDETSGGIVDKIVALFDTSSMNEEEYDDFVLSVTHIVRKTAHFTEYAALGFFLDLHLMTFLKKFPWLIGGIIGILYAASDEIHQLFISERSAQISDVMLDAAGVICGVASLCLLCLIINKIKTYKLKKKQAI